MTKIVEKKSKMRVNLKKAKTDAEAELLNSQENYKRTVDFLNIGMWTYYIRERKIVLGNNAATKMLRKNTDGRKHLKMHGKYPELYR